MRLFTKEFKGAVTGILYLVFVVAMAVFFFSQYYSGASWAISQDRDGALNSDFTEPVPGQESYGLDVFTNNPDLIMPNAIGRLLDEYDSNEYQTYPIGFVRYVRLSDTEQAEVAGIIEAVTGLSIEQAYDTYQAELEKHRIWVEEGEYYTADISDLDWSTIFTITIPYETFVSYMQQVDDLLGGGSAYAVDDLSRFSPEPKTYEMALEEFNESRYEDKFTRGYARLFCDYTGIDIALFAVFVPVAFMMRDGRGRAGELIGSRRCSSARLVITRYLACLAAVFLPVLLFATVATVQLVPYVLSKGFDVAPFAFYFYSFTWLLPTAMVCCSVGFFFTTLTGSPLGIAVQLVWSFLTFTGRNLVGDVQGAFLLRHNTSGERSLVMENFNLLLRNRVGFAVLALVLLGFSVWFYDLKRKGRLDVQAWFSRRFGSRTKTAPAHRAA